MQLADDIPAPSFQPSSMPPHPVSASSHFKNPLPGTKRHTPHWLCPMTGVTYSAREKHLHCNGCPQKDLPREREHYGLGIPLSKLLTWITFITINYHLLKVVIILTLLNPPQCCNVSVSISTA